MTKKKSAGRITKPTNRFSKSFLIKAWNGRKELVENEKRGFAQFFYITICGHLESVLVSIINARLRSISTIIKWEDIPSIKYENHSGVHLLQLDPIIQSVRQISKRLTFEVEAASLSKLMGLYGRVFPDNLKKVIGSDLYDDMDALSVLRNLFAHGGEMFMEFETEDFSTFTGVLDGNPLVKPAECLYRAGLVEKEIITGSNHGDFHSMFYSDEAMLYFYNAVQSIDDSLGKKISFMPERDWSSQDKLPPLEL